MVKEYTEKLYINSIDRAVELGNNDYKMAKELAKWKTFIKDEWHSVKIEPLVSPKSHDVMSLTVGESVTLKVKVVLGKIKPKDIIAEIYYGKLTEHNELQDKEWVTLNVKEKISDTEYIYEGEIVFKQKGDYGYTVRAMPYHKNLPHKHDAGLITWIS